METDLEAPLSELGQVPVTLCFIDLTGFTRYTEEEGEREALDVVENFVETVEATLPPEATVVKTIGDEVMVVSPEPTSLTVWAVGLLERFPDRPRPAGRHPLRRSRLPRRRLLRDPGQPRPPRRRPRPGRRGPRHRQRHRLAERARPRLRADRRGQPQGLPGRDPALPGPPRRIALSHLAARAGAYFRPPRLAPPAPRPRRRVPARSAPPPAPPPGSRLPARVSSRPCGRPRGSPRP